MKRLLIAVMILALAVGFAACGGNTPQTTPVPTEPSTVPPESTVPPTQPESDSIVGGIDLTGMTTEQAVQALNGAAAGYELNLTVNGRNLTVSAAEMGVSLDETALAAYLEALNAGSQVPDSIFTYDREALRSALAQGLNTAPQNVTVSYSASQKQFQTAGGAEGVEVDLDAAEAGAAAAIGLLHAAAEITVPETAVAPEFSRDSQAVQAALEKANACIGLNLTYTFTPEGAQTVKETLDAAAIASFIQVSEQMEVSVSKEAIEQYAAQMAERHNGADYKGKFKTTGGGSISSEVTYYGQKVNTSALTEDIYKCVTELQSGTRTAPYRAKSDMPYGGSYVEVDLSAQKLWLYKNGECILTTKLVSGSVAEKHCTPTGVYSIYAKQTDRYLTGADYRSFVHYWMPFLGCYGLHDASWRYSFGGDIYLYDGSHGCVNLPSSAAKKIYNNVSVGTKVILYGGKREVPDLEQKLTGKTSYEVTMGDAPFKLDAKAKYTGAKITYASSDTRVVRVSDDGTVSIVGEGTAVITVDAYPFEFYTGAELKITVTVKAAPATDPTDPSEPSQPSDPTDPSEPSQPSDPTDPSEPSQPSDPTDPSEPSQPSDPTDPSEPSQPSDPTEPEPTQPSDPTEPEPTQPSDPTEPEPSQPSDPSEPEPSEPVESAPAE